MNITIHQEEGGAFFVLHGDKFADGLTYEEMLGLVAQLAQLAMPTQRRALSWLKTADEWREDARRWAVTGKGVTTEFADPTAVPLKRSEVALVVGDQVVTRDGATGVVKDIEAEPSSDNTQPAWVDLSGLRITCYTLNGFYIPNFRGGHPDDIITINGHPIIED